ncbi:cytochrome P450 2A8-like [Brevipalpus obovatus]|uniref:cytochrome P450 2A8-like n=1 Tax=Brevipalpus obovatus TaxID=246614 RepID=UPI003D9F1D04
MNLVILCQQKSIYLVVVYCLIQRIKLKSRRPKRFPPGPYGLPIVGYLPFVSDHLPEDYIKLGKKYGSPFSIHLGKFDFIIINDWHHANEALQREELLARQPDGFSGGLLPGKGIMDLSGQPWKDQRRNVLHLLRDIGFGKSAMEDKIVEEIEIFVKELDKQRGKPINILSLLSASTSNNISVLTYGKRFEYDDDEKIELDYMIKKISEGTTFAVLAVTLPFLVKVLKFFGHEQYKFFMNTVVRGLEFDGSQIMKHQNSDYEHITDYIDGFLKQMEERKSKGLPPETFDLDTLKANIRTLFGAGSTTVYSTMSWIILLLVKHPHYQSRIREEISRVIGTRRPSYEDRLLMPFTVAFIYETLRYRTNVPLNLVRYATKDLYLKKTFIPKDTSVTINFYAIDHDPSLWTEPDKFMPERLLSPDQSKVIIPPHLTPFGAGKRKCIGENMALLELFQYSTSLVQRYILTSHEGPDKVSDVMKPGFISVPLHMPEIVIQSNKIQD